MKLLLIKCQEESSWGSCKVISPNLHSVYNNLGEEFQIEWFEVPQELIKGELRSRVPFIVKLKERLLAFRPDRLVFLDHLPVPANVLAHLSLHFNLRNLPPIIFHVYGDFTYFSSCWNFLNLEMKGHEIEFITASAAQLRLVHEFLEEKRGVSQLCFPVNGQEYFYDVAERLETRQASGIVEDEFVVLYSGRISLQKNVDLLIAEFMKIRRQTDKKLKLWIVGAFDDVGAEFLGYSTFQGHMFSKIQSLLSNYAEVENEDVVFWGHQPKEKLRKLKAAADYFISLSLYHDEDYGMSPAEALATGLPSLLTDWGGYSSFVGNDWDCQLVPVSITELGLEIGTAQIGKSLMAAMENQKKEHSFRAARASAFMSKFSIDSNTGALEHLLKKDVAPFGGFNWLLEQYASALGANWTKSKLNKFLNPDSRSFYHKIYKNYVSASNQEIGSE